MIENNFPILEEISNVFLNIIKANDFASLDWRKVQQSTQEDKTLCKLIKFCMDGWPERKSENDDIKIFWRKRDALSVENNCVLLWHRVVVPEKFKKISLKKIAF